MYRLTLTEYLITVAILLTLIFGASQLLHGWLVRVSEETSARIEKVQR